MRDARGAQPLTDEAIAALLGEDDRGYKFAIALDRAIDCLASMDAETQQVVPMAASQKGVLRAIVSSANWTTGLCWTSADRLAFFAGLKSRRWLAASTRPLEAAGLIRHVGWKRTGGPGGRVKVWRVDFQRLFRAAAVALSLFETQLRAAEMAVVPLEQAPLPLDEAESRDVSVRIAGRSVLNRGTLVSESRDVASHILFIELDQELNQDLDQLDSDLQREKFALKSSPGSSDLLPELWDDIIAEHLGPWTAVGARDRRQLLTLARQVDADTLEHVFIEAVNVTTPEKPALLILMLEQHRDQGCGNGWRPGEPTACGAWSTPYVRAPP